MKHAGRKWFYGFCIVAIVYILLSLIGAEITKNATDAEREENRQWIASGRFWVDRQLCRWLGVCGLFNMLHPAGWLSADVGSDPAAIPYSNPAAIRDHYGKFWNSGKEDPDSWSEEERRQRQIPQYVLDHAPYVHLFSREEFWPSDLAEHLEHVSPSANYTKIPDFGYDLDLENLENLDDYAGVEHGRYMYFQSNDNMEARPAWLVSTRNIPSPPEKPKSEAAWPSENDLNDLAAHLREQQILEAGPQTAFIDDNTNTPSSEREPSADGRCGGSSGYTCKDSGYGRCCSIYGWCGISEAYCGDSCDPLAGSCYNPYAPPQGPKLDLRKRSLDLPQERRKPDNGGRSSAPAFLIVVPKENGIVDAFWFFFYSFNLGLNVFDIRFGNHLGDWEHTMIRFKDGKPQEVFLSEHEWGDAYTWSAVEKYLPAADGSGTMIGSWSNATAGRLAIRPVVYSAIGSHAMYGAPGLHPYILPFGILRDETDRGPIWDPRQNFQAYTYDAAADKLRASLLNPHSPTGWFHYAGHWGDKYLRLGDPRQYRFAGQYHYVNGPTGPKFKNLGRSRVCQNPKRPCNVKNVLTGQWRPRPMPSDDDEGEPGGLPGGNHTDEARAAKLDLR